ncbi:ribosomal protein S20 [Ochrobactrum sp. 19YEA23]|nr:ribosomal protein S20 [Ochrobactrum sp. 19YEA23]
MANQRREVVNYQKLTGRAILSDGLLGVAREGGDLERKVAEGFFRLAGVAGQIANEYAEVDGARAGRAAALAGGPGAATVSGQVDPASAGGPVGGSFELSANFTGSKSAPGEIEAYVRSAAQKRGINPDHAVRVAKSEGGLNGFVQSGVTKNGRREPSFGPFQLLVGGGNTGFPEGLGNRFEAETGLRASDPANLFKTIDYALDEASKKGWGQWYGAKAVGIGNWDGIGRQAGVDPIQTGATPPTGVSPAVARSVAAPGVVPAIPQPKGLVEKGNIDLQNRPVVKNQDGSISTVRSISINEDGTEILIPTVSPDGKVLSDEKAVELYHQTGKHLGKFKDAKEADAYAETLHRDQERQYYNPQGNVNITPGKRGGFQPTNSSSIYGRAYDAAGTKTYLQQLDTTMRSDIFNVYMATKDDPVALQSKLNDLKKLQLEDHVFDEIRPEYENAFARMTQPYIEQAIRDKETRKEQQNRAEFLSRTSELETDVQRRIASVSADNPGAVDAVQSAQTAIDDHFDAAVTLGVMSADDAAKAKITSRRATAVGFYLRQAENLPSDKVAALRKTMQTDFAAGGLDGLDGDGWEILDAKLDALERSKRVEDNQAKTALTKRGNDFVERLAAGFEVDEAAFAKFKLDASTATGGQAIVDETVAKIDLAHKLGGLPIKDAQAKVMQLRRDLGSNPTDAQLRTYGYASDFVEAKAKLLADDPVAFVQNADPTVRAAWNEVSADNPASFEKAVSATVAAQERLGVVSPKILPKSVAQAAVSQFNNAKLEDNDRIAGVTNLMFATEDRAQRRAIFDQMVGAGLDGFTEGAFNALDRGDPEAARRLFQAAMLDPDKQPGTLSVKPSEIDDEIQANIMADGKIGDIYYGLSGGTAQNYLLAERDAKLMKRSVQMRLRAGQDVNAAVAGVARDLYGDVVPIQRNGSVNAEILLPRDRDPADVMAGLNEMKSRVRSALEAAVSTPAGVKVSDGGRAIHDAVTKNHIASILDEGVFRSAGDGFVFIDSYSGLAVPGKDGKPLLFSLEDVTSSGRAALEARKSSDPIGDLNEWRAGQ